MRMIVTEGRHFLLGNPLKELILFTDAHVNIYWSRVCSDYIQEVLFFNLTTFWVPLLGITGCVISAQPIHVSSTLFRHMSDGSLSCPMPMRCPVITRSFSLEMSPTWREPGQGKINYTLLCIHFTKSSFIGQWRYHLMKVNWTQLPNSGY